MEEGYSGGWCVCVYVDSHLRFQFNLTGSAECGSDHNMLCAHFALSRRFYHFPRTGINRRRFDIGKFCRVTRDQRSEETVLQKYQRGVEANLTHEQPSPMMMQWKDYSLHCGILWCLLRMMFWVVKGKYITTGSWRIGSALSHWWIDAISAIMLAAGWQASRR